MNYTVSFVKESFGVVKSWLAWVLVQFIFNAPILE